MTVSFVANNQPFVHDANSSHQEVPKRNAKRLRFLVSIINGHRLQHKLSCAVTTSSGVCRTSLASFYQPNYLPSGLERMLVFVILCCDWSNLSTHGSQQGALKRWHICSFHSRFLMRRLVNELTVKTQL